MHHYHIYCSICVNLSILLTIVLAIVPSGRSMTSAIVYCIINSYCSMSVNEIILLMIVLTIVPSGRSMTSTIVYCIKLIYCSISVNESILLTMSIAIVPSGRSMTSAIVYCIISILQYKCELINIAYDEYRDSTIRQVYDLGNCVLYHK